MLAALIFPVPPVVESLSSSAAPVSLVITRSLPSPVSLEEYTRRGPALVPVSIIFAVTPKLSSALLIASRSSVSVIPAVTSIVKLSLPPTSNVNEPAPVLKTASVDDVNAPSSVVIRLPEASCSTVIS